MSIFIPPVKRVQTWGWTYEPKKLDEFWRAVNRSGQGFYGNGVPACKIIEGASCDISIYQYWGMKSHGGEDVPCPHKEPILNSADGVVHEINTDRGTGLGVVVWHPQYKLKTIHWHLDSLDVKLGQEVKQGQVLGLADSTGASTGTHDHWACKETDDNGNTINKDNGWLGNIPFRDKVGWFDEMKLTRNQVLALQILDGYSDPEGADFWEGRELTDYLKARLNDKLKQEKEVLEKL